MSFFKQFPKINYDLQETNQLSRRVDIFRHVDVSGINTDNYTNYLYYEIKDGERPDIVSHKLYSTPNYYWTFFIINDFLQAGFNKWYKSDADLHRGLELEYDDLGALIFIPNYTSAANLIGGLDITFEGLRFALVGGSPQETAKIEKFDAFMQQMVISGTSSSSFYNSDGTYHFAFSSDASSSGKLDFLEKYTAHLKKIDIIPEESATLSESNLSSYTYTPERAYSSLLTAPYKFKAIDDPASTFDKDDEIGAIDALNNDFGSVDSYRSWFDYETEENEKRRKILFIIPEQIEGFVQRYKNLINA